MYVSTNYHSACDPAPNQMTSFPNPNVYIHTTMLTFHMYVSTNYHSACDPAPSQMTSFPNPEVYIHTTADTLMHSVRM
jgi:hypothetical protein